MKVFLRGLLRTPGEDFRFEYGFPQFEGKVQKGDVVCWESVNTDSYMAMQGVLEEQVNTDYYVALQDIDEAKVGGEWTFDSDIRSKYQKLEDV